LGAIDSRFVQGVIKQPAGWAHKRFTGEIFFVTWLLADKKDFSAASAFSEDGLSAAFPKFAAFAISGRVPKSF
jgi:hypothetical protein